MDKKMKKYLLPLLLVTILALASCASPKNPTMVILNLTQAAATFGPGKVSAAEELIIGTLKLQGTAQAPTKDQAAALLPLWSRYQSLTLTQVRGQAQTQTASSVNKAQADALLAQIRSEMTAEQLKAITEMKINQQTVLEVMQDLGISMGEIPGDLQGTPPADMPQAQGNPQPGMRQMQGTPGAGFDGTRQPRMQGTRPAGFSETPGAGQFSSGGGFTSPLLLNALIQSLAETAGVTLTPTPG
jgi:hypothetical protein